jgi:hypothetical protein
MTMNTAELIRNDNVYRATGGKCWYATFENVRTEDGIRYIRPCVLRVEIVGRSSPTAVYVTPVRGQGKVIADRDNLFDDRGHAMEQAVALCDLLDGTSVRGFFTYKVVRPKARKPEPAELELRIRQPVAGAFYVEHWDASKRRWICVHTHRLTRWKANDMARRIKAGDDVPGFWREPGTMNWIELVDQADG